MIPLVAAAPSNYRRIRLSDIPTVATPLASLPIPFLLRVPSCPSVNLARDRADLRVSGTRRKEAHGLTLLGSRLFYRGIDDVVSVADEAVHKPASVRLQLPNSHVGAEEIVG